MLPNKRKIKILITGSSGFIGSYLTDYLQGQGEVTTVPHTRLHDRGYLRSLAYSNYNYIFHLASYGNMYHQQEGNEIIKANVEATYNLLEATKQIPYLGFVNVSSSSVYGSSVEPMQEDMEVRPTTLYAVTKATGEHLAQLYALQGKAVITARLFTVYGAGEPDFRFIPTVCRSLKYGTEFVLDPHAYHTFIHVSDVVKGLSQVASYAEAWKGQVVNIGSEEHYRNEEIVHMLEMIAGKKADYTVKEGLREGHSTLWRCDTKRMKEMKIYPKVDIWKGLREVYQSV